MLHPYIRSRMSRTELVVVVLSILFCVVGHDLAVPQRSRLVGGELLSRPLGPLCIVGPAIVLAATLGEPAGVLADVRARSLRWIRLGHLAFVLGAPTVGAFWISGGPLGPDPIQSGWAGLVLATAAVLSSLLFGSLGSWVGPSVLLCVQLVPLPLPLALATWSETTAWGQGFWLAVLPAILLTIAGVTPHYRPPVDRPFGFLNG